MSNRDALNEQLEQYGERRLAWYEQTPVEPLVNMLDTARGVVVDGAAFAVQALTSVMRTAHILANNTAPLGEVAEVVERD